jgi:O-antigen/teichoic acid export membrane protein
LGLVCQSISSGFEKLEDVTIAVVLGNALKLILGLYVLKKGYGLTGLMIVLLSYSFIVAFISLFFVMKYIAEPIHRIWKIDVAFCKWLIKKTPVFALIFIVATIRIYINIPILTTMLGEREVGFYDAAYRLVNICSLAIGFYLIAIRPTLYRLYKESMDKFEYACKESIRYLFIMILPIIIGVTVLSKKLILIFYQTEFLPSALALNILIWILVLNGFNQIFACALISSDNQKINLNANILGLIVNVVLSLLLIPKLSFIGAGIANISAAFITFMYQYYIISKSLFTISFFHIVKRPLVASLLYGVFVFFLRDLNIFILIALSPVVYAILAVITKVFSLKDFNLLRKLWSGKEDIRVPIAQL